jgi:hypothetical protein
VSHYQAIAHRVGTIDALELGRRLSSWHDRMVAHERLARSRQTCDETCPHAQAIELWRDAVQILGDGAERLTFLKTTATEAAMPAAGPGTIEQRRSIA